MYKHCLNCSSYATRNVGETNNSSFSIFLGILCVFAVHTSAVLSATSSIVKLSGSSGQQRCCFEKNGYCPMRPSPNPKNWGIPKRERRGKCAKHLYPDFCGAKKNRTGNRLSRQFRVSDLSASRKWFFLCVCGNLWLSEWSGKRTCDKKWMQKSETKKMAARVLIVSVALLSSLGADGIGREDDT